MRTEHGNHGSLELDPCRQPKEHGKKQCVQVLPNVQEDFLQRI